MSGLFYRTANFVEEGIRPVYVFDGKPPVLKRLTIEQRRAARIEAEGEWKKALEEGRVQEAKKFAQRAGRLDASMIKQAQVLLDRMGLPWVQAPSEGRLKQLAWFSGATPGRQRAKISTACCSGRQRLSET